MRSIEENCTRYVGNFFFFVIWQHDKTYILHWNRIFWNNKVWCLNFFFCCWFCASLIWVQVDRLFTVTFWPCRLFNFLLRLCTFLTMLQWFNFILDMTHLLLQITQMLFNISWIDLKSWCITLLVGILTFTIWWCCWFYFFCIVIRCRWDKFGILIVIW